MTPRIISRRRTLVFLWLTLFTFRMIASGVESTWVHFGIDGKLTYQTWGAGNRIMDFSGAGYKGGGVAIPDVATVQTINPSGSDDTSALQAAINAVAARSLSNGFRGALQLGPGTFHVSDTLGINSSGVIIRGSGSGANGTTIQMTGTTSFTLFDISGSGSPSQSSKVNITDTYVPSGTTTFTVSSTSGYSVGTNVIIGRTVTTDWIHFMGMDTLVRDGAPQTWISAGTVITTDRTIKAISGNQITLDAPLTDSFDSIYLGTPVGTMGKYTWSGRISQVGLENLRIEAPAVTSGFTSVSFDSIIDSWARNLVIQDGVNCFNVSKDCKRMTVDNVIVNHTVVSTASAAPSDFACTGTQILFNKCQANGTGSWPFVMHTTGTGPIVLLNCSGTQDRGVAPHQRWCTGILADSCFFPNAQSSGNKEGIAYANRGTAGSGHGWTTGWSVAWNVTSPYLLASAAPGTENWCIGGVGSKRSNSDPDGIFESLGTKVTLGQTGSLYLEQLRERLGDSALANIGYLPLTSPPEFNPPGGTYQTTQTVTMTSDTVGATIRYTTDGSTPTTTFGSIYTGPITISTTTTLQAIAYKAGITPSDVVSVTYTIDPNFYFEAESLTRTGVGANPNLETDTNTSGGQWISLLATGVNQYIEYTIPNLPAGTYDVTFLYKTHPNRGILSFAVDGNVLVTSLDQYSNPVAYPEHDMGNVTFGSAGSHIIRMTVIGKNLSSGAYTLSADRFEFTPIANTAPAITSIADQSIAINASTSGLGFTVGDTETSPSTLTLMKSSSNPTLVPLANVAFNGTAASRTVTITPATDQSGSATITVTVSDGALSANKTFTVNVTPTPTQTWRLQYFGTALNTGNAADLADPDFDGVPNLLENGLNGDPTIASPGITPVCALEGNNLTLTYPRRKAAVGELTFTVEWATNPAGPWSATGVSESVLSDDGTVQQIKASVPSVSPATFMHLRVTKP